MIEREGREKGERERAGDGVGVKIRNELLNRISRFTARLSTRLTRPTDAGNR